MPVYDYEAIRDLVSAAQANAGGIGQIADGLPNEPDEKAFGEMAVSKDVHGGLNGFTGSMSDQFSRAESLLNGVARSLDDTLSAIEAQEDENVSSLTPNDVEI